MADRRPPWLRHLDKLDDRARYAAMSPEARLQVFAEVCAVADALLAGRSDRDEILNRSDPMSDDAKRTWLRLVAESMRERDCR